jgi:transcriptional regulator with XRE-family HTH domain
MTFQQLNERLRQELLRRIERGTLSGKLISCKTGYGQPHISNFLRGKRRLSLDALDRLLNILQMSVEDLLPSRAEAAAHPPADPKQQSEKETKLTPKPGKGSGIEPVPLVTQLVALEEQVFEPAQILGSYPVPAQMLANLRTYCRPSRRSWQRFAAIRLRSAQIEGMEPLLLPGAMVVVDRHYTSLQSYDPLRPSLYAVRCAQQLMIRLLTHEGSLLILRPYQAAHPVSTIELLIQQSPSDYIVGRVVLSVNPI